MRREREGGRKVEGKFFVMMISDIKSMIVDERIASTCKSWLTDLAIHTNLQPLHATSLDRCLVYSAESICLNYFAI